MTAEGIEQDQDGVQPLTMTLEEVCFELGIGLTKGYELARRDALPIRAFRVGRTYRFSRPAFDRLLALDGHLGDAV